MNKNNLQASEPLQPYFKSRKGISQTSLHCGVLNKICRQFFFHTIRSMRESNKITTNQLRMRTTFQRVLNQEFFFGSWVAAFSRNLSCWSISSYVPFSTRKPHAKAVPKRNYFTQRKQYHQRTTLRTWPWKMRERDAEWSAPNISRHIHGTSVLFGT